MQIPWISGIQPPTASASWQERVYAVVTNAYSRGAAREKTAEAESGLEIRSSVYWYVMRASEHFGFIIFLWHEAEAVKWAPKDGAAAPFDTGGLWHGRIATTRSLSDSEKRQLIARVSVTLPEWRESFMKYLSDNYTAPEEYVNGNVPRTGVVEIRYDGTNSQAAWTWEARVCRAASREQVRVASIYWTEDDRRAFEEWLTERDDLDELEVVHLLRHIAGMSSTTPPDELPSVTVQRHLIGVARDGR